jgi:hypothetical protein
MQVSQINKRKYTSEFDRVLEKSPGKSQAEVTFSCHFYFYVYITSINLKESKARSGILIVKYYKTNKFS